MPSLSKDLPPSPYLFSAFIGDFMIPIFNTFVPLFAYELGANPLVVGLVGGATWGVYSFMPFIIGRYSDRMRERRNLMVLSLSVLGVTSVLYSLAASPTFLIILRVVEGIGWSLLWPTLDALIGEDTSRETTKFFSIYNCVWAAATAIGPLVGATMVAILADIRFVFVLTAVLSGVAASVNLVGLIRGREPSSRTDKVESNTDRTPGARQVTDPEPSPHGGISATLKFWMIAMAFVWGTRSIMFTFFPPLARSVDLSVFSIGIIVFVSGLALTLTFVATTREKIRNKLLQKKRVRTNALAALGLASVAGVLPIIPNSSELLGLVSFALIGMAAAITTTLAQAGMIISSDPKQIGRNSGLFEISIGIGSALGPIFAGLISGTSFFLPFLVPSIGILAIPVLARFFRDGT
jgi:MFS family permease